MATPPASLLRIVRQTKADDSEKADTTVELTPLCTDSIQICFNHMDRDNDKALSFEELSEYIRLTEGETFTREYYDNLTRVVSTNENDYVTFEGLIALYKFYYDEKGPTEGDKNLWKDLKLFGFNADLTHSGELPQLQRDIGKENQEIQKKRKHTKDAFAVLQGKKTVNPKPAKRKKRTKTNATERAVIDVTCEENSLKEVKQTAKNEPESETLTKRVVEIVSPGKLTAKPCIRAKSVNPFFSRVKTAKAAPSGKNSTKAVLSKTHKSKSWYLPYFPVATDGTEVHVNYHCPSVSKSEPASTVSETANDGIHEDANSNYFENNALLSGETPKRLLVKRFCHEEVEWTDEDIQQYLVSQTFRDLVAAILGADKISSICDDNARKKRLKAMFHQRYVRGGKTETKKNAWFDIYSPQSSEQFSGNEQVAIGFQDWLNSWHPTSFTGDQSDSDEDDLYYDQEGTRKGCLLLGESGSGKTSIVSSCANLAGRKIIEVNPSSLRSGHELNQMIGESTQSHTLKSKSSRKKGKCHSKALLLLDECDIIFDEDKGFVNALIQIIQLARIPVVLTCNMIPEGIEDKYGPNAKLSLLDIIRISRPDKDSLCSRIVDICIVEGLGIPHSVISKIVAIHENDPRLCLNVLQFWFKKDHDYEKKKNKLNKENNINVVDMPMPSCLRDLEKFTEPTLLKLHSVGDISSGGLDPYFNVCVGANGEDDGGLLDIPIPRSLDLSSIFRMYFCLLEEIQSLHMAETRSNENVLEFEANRIVPNTASVYGGTKLVIEGKGFKNTAITHIEVTIGGNLCNNLEVLSDTTLSVICPAYTDSDIFLNVSNSTAVYDRLLIEDASDEDDFVEAELNTKSNGNRLLWPSDVVIVAKLQDGYMVSTDDDKQRRFNGMFQYCVGTKPETAQPPVNVDEPVLSDRNAGNPAHETSSQIGDLSILHTLMEHVSACDLVSVPKTCGDRKYMHRICPPYQIIDYEDEPNDILRGCNYIPEISSTVEYLACKEVMALRGVELGETRIKRTKNYLKEVVGKQCKMTNTLYSVASVFSMGPSVAGRCAMTSRQTPLSLIEHVGALSEICKVEQIRKKESRQKRRFFHYFDNIKLYLVDDIDHDSLADVYAGLTCSN